MTRYSTNGMQFYYSWGKPPIDRIAIDSMDSLLLVWYPATPSTSSKHYVSTTTLVKFCAGG